MTELETDNERLKKTIANLCEDWAEDHTHLQELCIKAGCDAETVYDNSVGILSISDLADMLVKQLNATKP